MESKMARKKFTIPITGHRNYKTAPITGSKDVTKVLGKEYGDFPFYGFFLYSTMDTDLINFLN